MSGNPDDKMLEPFDELSEAEIEAIRLMEAACPPAGDFQVEVPTQAHVRKYLGVSLTDAVKAASQGG